MYDKISFKARIDESDIDTIVLREYLEQYTRGDEIFYRSTAYANLTGVTIEINGNVLKCKCSINKLFYKQVVGKLDNSRPMTFANATKTIKELLMRLCIKAKDAYVTYYEIGLTMRMSHSPDTYIRAIQSGIGRTFWNDPSYPEMRQKVTEKSKYFRKILKMYDKTFEATEKGREVIDNVLRVETIYKHQSVPMITFLDKNFQTKQAKRFYDDWSHIQFRRELKAKKGVKLSQLVKAREIHSLGVTPYLDKYRTLWKAGEITKKTWQTIREYGNAWNTEKERYDEIISEEEREYQEKLLNLLQIGIITSKQ